MGDNAKLQELMQSYKKTHKVVNQKEWLDTLDPLLKKNPIDALQEIPELAGLLNKNSFVKQLMKGNGSIEEHRQGLEAIREYRDTLGIESKNAEKKYSSFEIKFCQKAFESLSQVFAHEQENIKRLASSVSHENVYTAFALASPLPEARKIIGECMKSGKLQELLVNKKLPSYIKQNDLNVIVENLPPSSAKMYFRFASVLERIAHGDGSKEDSVKGEKILQAYTEKFNNIVGSWQSTTGRTGDTQVNDAKEILDYIKLATPALQDIQAYQSGQKQSMTAAAAKGLGLKPGMTINREEKNEAAEVEKPKLTR